jgi:hypothetical protein
MVMRGNRTPFCETTALAVYQRKDTMGSPGLFIFVQVLVIYGIPLLILSWFIRQVREARNQRQEMIQRLAQIEAKLGQRTPIE